MYQTLVIWYKHKTPVVPLVPVVLVVTMVPVLPVLPMVPVVERVSMCRYPRSSDDSGTHPPKNEFHTTL